MIATASGGRDVLEAACSEAGFDASRAEPIRLAENALWRLPNHVVVRIAKSGQLAAAEREIAVAHWLETSGVPAVRALDLRQPVVVDGRPVTFWEELPEHEHGSVADVVGLLKRLHALPKPDLDLGRLDPFVRVAERIDAASGLLEDDRQWLRDRLSDLRSQWETLPPGLPECVVHGDAWVGNVAVTAGGPLLLDFERVSIGPPEWDLVSTAVKLTTTGSVSPAEYEEFCSEYGTDVTEWAGYDTLAGVRTLRMTTYAAQHAAEHSDWRHEAQHRVDCLRGRAGSPPWNWKAIM